VSGVFRFLVSFHYHQKTDLQRIVDSYHGPCEVFADSGAFSAASLGATIDLEQYAAWLKEWDHLLTVKATLDVIGDYRATMRNTAVLERMGVRVLPVFHVGTPWPVLEELCARYDYVALGGMVPHATNADAVMRWLVQCFKVARKTGTVFHGFGQTNLRTMAALPFYSVDSSSWGAGARFGTLSLWDATAHTMVKLKTGERAVARRYAGLLREHGASPALVGAPGFAMKARRDPAQYVRENQMMRGVPAVAYMRMGEYLAKRHKVPVPPSLASAVVNQSGTHVFLADGAESQLRSAAQGASAAGGGYEGVPRGVGAVEPAGGCEAPG